MTAMTALKNSLKLKGVLPVRKSIALVLPWPSGLRATAVRRKWHQRLSDSPPGLSLKELVKRLAQPYASVAFWARRFKYPYTKLRRGRKTHIDWDHADWS